MMLLPPPPGTCPVCAAHHPDCQSLYYQYRFHSLRGRWPTWADAIAHCAADIRTAWRRALEARGAWSEPEDGEPIADPPAESLHMAHGDQADTPVDAGTPRPMQ